MTIVHVDLRTPDLTPATGSLTIRTEVREHHAGDPDYIRLTRPAYTVPLSGGVADLDLEPTRPGQAYVITERVVGGTYRIVQVPDIKVVDYGDLPDIDPDTLDPTTPEALAAWSALQAQVDTLTQTVTDQQAQLDQAAAINAATTQGRWKWSTDTTPSDGRMTATTDTLTFHRLTTEKADASVIFQRLTTGSRIRVQERGDSRVFRTWDVTAPATADGDTWTVSAAITGGQGDPPREGAYLLAGFQIVEA